MKVGEIPLRSRFTCLDPNLKENKITMFRLHIYLSLIGMLACRRKDPDILFVTTRGSPYVLQGDL